jgi:fumarylacetoacetase
MSTTDGFDGHFGLQNIPFGIVSSGTQIPAQAATRIQGYVILLAALAEAGHFKDIEYPLANIFKERTLNTFAALPKSVHLSVRKTLQSLFHGVGEEISLHLPRYSVLPVYSVQMHLPVRIGDFTDFSVSAAHNLRAGEAILGKSFLPPAFKHFPMGYGGRSSSIIVSGTPIERPLGQFVDRSSGEEKKVILSPSRAVDYELEVAAVVGKPVAMGERLNAQDADDHIFGVSSEI